MFGTSAYAKAALGTADVPATGLQGTMAVGSVFVDAGADVSVTGVSGTGSVGSVTMTGSALVLVSGVLATGRIGQVTARGKIVPNPDTIWTRIAA